MKHNSQYFALLISLQKDIEVNCININFYTKNESENKGKIEISDGPNYILIFGIIFSIILFINFIYVIRKLKNKEEPEKEINELYTNGKEVLKK